MTLMFIYSINYPINYLHIREAWIYQMIWLAKKISNDQPRASNHLFI
jgi:hypothetical protein